MGKDIQPNREPTEAQVNHFFGGKEFVEEWNRVCAMFKGVTWVKPGEGGKKLRIGVSKKK